MVLITSIALLPNDIAERTGDVAGVAVAVVIALLLLGTPLVLTLVRQSVVWRRFGIRDSSKLIITRRRDIISIGIHDSATIRSTKHMVFLEYPLEDSLVDLFDIELGKQLESSKYLSTDSTIRLSRVGIDGKTAIVYWTPRTKIIPFVPYVHKSEFVPPVVYGPEAFYQSYYVDCDTGVAEWRIKAVRRIELTLSCLMPVGDEEVNQSFMYDATFNGANRDCEQPTLSENGMEIRWTLKQPIKGRKYVLFGFYEGTVERFRAENPMIERLRDELGKHKSIG